MRLQNLLEAIAKACIVLEWWPTREEARPKWMLRVAVRLKVVSLHSPAAGLRIVNSQCVARGVRIERVVPAAVRHLNTNTIRTSMYNMWNIISRVHCKEFTKTKALVICNERKWKTHALIDVFDESVHIDEPGVRVLIHKISAHANHYVTCRVRLRLQQEHRIVCIKECCIARYWNTQ